MKTKYEPCSICEKYMDGVACDEHECPVAIMKAEIELYKNLNLTSKEQYIVGYCEGVKEFAERLKENFKNSTLWGLVSFDRIDNLVKEMTGSEKK